MGEFQILILDVNIQRHGLVLGLGEQIASTFNLVH